MGRAYRTNASAINGATATASSVSGEAYQIRCGAHAPVASATWLTAELKRLRTSS